jgi:hypothetical protein
MNWPSIIIASCSVLSTLFAGGVFLKTSFMAGKLVARLETLEEKVREQHSRCEEIHPPQRAMVSAAKAGGS